jgi:hypothetical protein
MSWDPYIEDPLDGDPDITALLPSSLKEILGDDPRIPSAPAVLSSHIPNGTFYSVHFHENRRETLASSVHFEAGDFVITDADRGLDIGRIIQPAGRPQFRELKNIKSIVRKATQGEIDAIPGKQERERSALMYCQAKVHELGLPMEITGAEFQFDGKKLTFYYSASKYVDFRNLVKGLFRIFGTRIWMVWFDGNAPVKDVFSRGVEDA